MGKKIKLLSGAIAFTGCITVLPAVGQSSFQNLDFEAATVTQAQSWELVTVNEGLPGWNVFDQSGTEVTNLGYNMHWAGRPASLFSPNGELPSIEGNFSPYLVGAGVNLPGGSITFTAAGWFSQSGFVPETAQSIFFKAVPGTSLLRISLDGVNVPLEEIGIGPNYSLYGGDISAFAGMTTELRLTIGYRGTGWLFDSIEFSDFSVPEPSTTAIAVVGLGLLLWKRRRVTNR